jgi:hypothetical protein
VVAGRGLAALVGVEVGEGCCAVAIVGDWGHVQVVGWKGELVGWGGLR